MKYFYIITRDKAIHELEYTEEKYKKTIALWQQKGIILAKSKGDELPFGVNGTDVVQVLTEGKYKQWIKSTTPKKYIRNGTWYDGKEGTILSNEPWKEKELEKQLQLEQPNVYAKGAITPARWDEFRVDMKKMFPSYKWNTKR